MVEIACEHLPAAKLNHLSYHMATHIDVTLRDRGVWHSNLNHQVSEELDSENPKRGRKVAVIRPRHH
jgi:hypothetical protein